MNIYKVMIKKHIILFLLSIFLCFACTSLNVKYSSLNRNELIPYQGHGTASIKGSFFLRTTGGDIKSGAGKNIYLYPNVIHVRDYFNSIHTRTLFGKPKMDESIMDFRRETICDINGTFYLKDIPAGEWIVSGELYWMINNHQQTGDTVWQIVTLTNGEQKEIILTHTNKLKVF